MQWPAMMKIKPGVQSLPARVDDSADVQARESSLSKQYRGMLRSAPQDDLFFHRLRSSNDMNMALMVRIAWVFSIICA